MTYDYKCEACNHELIDIKQSIHEKPLKRCPKCRKHKLFRVIYGPIEARVNNGPQTFGQLDEANKRAAGKYAMSEAKEKFEKSRKTHKEAWWGEPTKKESKKLLSMTDKQKEKYILTGEGNV